MYSEENIELFLLAREDWMSIKGAAAFAKVNYNAAKDWIYKGLPHSYTGALRKSQCARIQKSAKSSGEKEYLMSETPYDPPKSGLLAGLSFDQIENLLLRAVLADLKALAWLAESERVQKGPGLYGLVVQENVRTPDKV